MTRFWALLAAGGQGSRMASSTPKQYHTLGNRTLLDHCIAAFMAQPIHGVMVSADTIYPASDRIHSCLGGATRTESVYNGLIAIASIDQSNPVVLVHDAARPCIHSDDIAQCLDALEHNPEQPLILARKATESIKRGITDNGTDYIQQSLPREHIWQAATPQCARLQILATAINNRTAEATDEAGYLEQAGYRVRLLAAQHPNPKITFPEDIAMASALLAQRH